MLSLSEFADASTLRHNLGAEAIFVLVDTTRRVDDECEFEVDGHGLTKARRRRQAEGDDDRKAEIALAKAHRSLSDTNRNGNFGADPSDILL